MGNAANMLSADRATPKLAGMTETWRPATGADHRPPEATTVWRRATRAAYVETDRRAVVLDLDHLDLPPYVFEGTAAVVWTCLDGDRTEGEIIDDLAEAYEVEAAMIAPDVRQFVDRLRSLGLVVGGS